MLTHDNCITGIMNQRLYLLNQLWKQRLDIKCLAILVIARFQYALPAFAGQLTISDINRINSIFAKRFKWRLTTKLFKANDIIEHWDKQLFRAILISDHCLNEFLPPRKNYLGRNLGEKLHGFELPLAKTERFKSSFAIRCLYHYT